MPAKETKLMCGIAGFVDRNPSNFENEIDARAMGDALQHRGPDSSGIWVNAERGIAMVHRRLAIVDLSDAVQPMTFLQEVCSRI